jgi:uncharacterized protein with PIN domain
MSKAWMCESCGYVMNATSDMRGRGAVPKARDVSMCLNCTALYVMHGTDWKRATAQEIATIGPDEQRLIAVARKARLAISMPNVSRRGDWLRQ